MIRKLYIILLSCLIFTTITYSMEQQLTNIEVQEQKVAAFLKQVPEDLGICIVHLQLLDIHNQVNTPEQARDYLISVSLVNKYCNQLANDPHIIKNIVNNLSATLRDQGVFIWYEENIAEKLNTHATKKYLEINNQFFSQHLTKSDVVQLLKQGADPNYRRNIRDKNFHDPNKYYVSRHWTTTMPLSFFASGSTNNDLEIAQYLLEHGANIDNTTASYSSPLAIAIKFEFINMVELLLSYNPKFSEYNPGLDRHYLTQAIQRRNPKIINLLIKANNPDFTSALKASINIGDIQQIQELFNHGAKPDSLLKEVTAATTKFPYLTPDNNWFVSTLKTTDILKLFCENGIENAQALEDSLAYAKTTKQRAKEVIKILESTKKIALFAETK